MQLALTIMVTAVRIVLLALVLLLPGGLLLLPLLAVYQVKHSKKAEPVVASHAPYVVRVHT